MSHRILALSRATRVALAALVWSAALWPLAADSQEERQRTAPTTANPELPKMDIGPAMRIQNELKEKNIPLRGTTSYIPVAHDANFPALVEKMSAAEAGEASEPWMDLDGLGEDF